MWLRFASLVICVGCVLVAASSARAQWVVQAVDSVGMPTGQASLAFDSSGHARLSYYNSDTGSVRYAAWNGSMWTIQDLGAASYTGVNSMALDSTGKPSIAYAWDDPVTGVSNLKMASWSGTAWSTQTVEPLTADKNVSLALNSSGQARISYAIPNATLDGSNVRVASWNGTGWTFQTVDSGGLNGANSALSLNSAGVPRIALTQDSVNIGTDANPVWTDPVVRYATSNGASWTVQTVATGEGPAPAMSLDATGQGRVAYLTSNQGQYSLNLGVYNGATWSSQAVDDNTPYSNGASMKTVAGNAIISYFGYSADGGTTVVKLAKQNGAVWNVQTVAQSAGWVSNGITSLAIDPTGRAWVAFEDPATDLLMLARPTLAGDANNDGRVKFGDYLTFEQNFGKTGMGWQQGDFNGDGKVSLADYLLLEQDFGKAVPEPMTMAILASGLGLTLLRRRRSD